MLLLTSSRKISYFLDENFENLVQGLFCPITSYFSVPIVNIRY